MNENGKIALKRYSCRLVLRTLYIFCI